MCRTYFIVISVGSIFFANPAINCFVIRSLHVPEHERYVLIDGLGAHHGRIACSAASRSPSVAARAVSHGLNAKNIPLDSMLAEPAVVRVRAEYR